MSFMNLALVTILQRKIFPYYVKYIFSICQFILFIFYYIQVNLPVWYIFLICKYHFSVNHERSNSHLCNSELVSYTK